MPEVGVRVLVPEDTGKESKIFGGLSVELWGVTVLYHVGVESQRLSVMN